MQFKRKKKWNNEFTQPCKLPFRNAGFYKINAPPHTVPTTTADAAPGKVANAKRNFENFSGTTYHRPYFALPPILPYNFATVPTTTSRDERTR